MRILILADLHHDFWESKPQSAAALRDALQALGPVDAAILAGDVANKARIRWASAARSLDGVVERANTYVFPGNHDYYQHRIDGEDVLAQTAQELGWQWAQKRAVVLDGVRFLCATLWTDLRLGRSAPENGQLLASRMNDYRVVRVAHGGYRRLRPEDTGRIHAHHLHWLDTELRIPHNGPTAVITHHSPHPDTLSQRDDTYDAAYASDLGDFLRHHAGPGGRFWFFGHAHQAQPIDRFGWHLRPHSLGYPDEKPAILARLQAAVVDTASL